MAFPAFIIPLITAALSAGAAVYSAENQPKPAGNLKTPDPAGAAPNDASSVFAVNTPGKGGMTPGPINQQWSPDSLFQMILAGQQPGSGVLRPQDAAPPPVAAPAPQKAPTPATAGPKGSEVMQAIPEALAAIAPLLAMAGQDRRGQVHVVGAQGGGAGGSLVPGLNLPQRRSVGELLASLPRPRYNG